MSLSEIVESILIFPKKVFYSLHAPYTMYELGVQLPNNKFFLVAKTLARIVANDTECSYLAGINWSDEKFLPVAEIIAKGVAKDPEKSNLAGRDWTDEKFFPVAEIIAKGVEKNAGQSYSAGENWLKERFLPVAEIIARGVAKHLAWSNEAGMYWSDEKFLPVAEIIARGIAKDATWSYEAAMQWKQKRFLDTAHILAPALDEEHLVKLRASDSLNKYVVQLYQNQGEEGLEKVKKLNDHYQVQWYKFAERCDHTHLAKLPLVDLQRSADILDYLKPHPEGQDKFFESFNVILERGEVRPWTKSVLKELQSAGQGGTNYRILEVTI